MIFLDLETYSDVDINPLDEYCKHPSTKVILACIAKDDEEIVTLEGDSIVEKLRAWFKRDPLLCAWNVTFERTVLAGQGLRTGIERWHDAMVGARQLGFPGHLKQCCKVPVLNIPADKTTQKETLLINKFCKPDGFKANPGEWEAFKNYCRQDVEATRAIQRYLEQYPPSPEGERKMWELDQRINYRGLPIDVRSCRHAASETDRLVSEAKAKLATLTGLENPNSVVQLHPWLQARGYKYDSLGKEFLEQSLSECDLEERARRVVEIRLDAAKSSVKKFQAILEEVSSDGRLRAQYKYYGAHTGRWAGRGAQPQNPPRKAYTEADLAALTSLGEISSLDSLSALVRPMICASAGKKLVVGDYSSIENRVLMWVADCPAGLSVFEKGLDPYIEFASRFYKRAYKFIIEEERQICKPPVLGCGFGLGGGQMRVLVGGQITYTGLKAYAENYGVELDLEQCREMVQLYRNSYPEVPALWRHLEEAFYHCTRNKKRQRVGCLEFGAVADAIYIQLPSQRRVYYVNPVAYLNPMGGRELGFDGFRGHSWGRVSTWGGKLTENVVQAIARDVLVEGITGAEKMGMPVVGHSHDEIISEVDEAFPALSTLGSVMARSLPWAPGLPLAAKCWEGERYKK